RPPSGSVRTAESCAEDRTIDTDEWTADFDSAVAKPSPAASALQLQQILATASMPVFDVRFELEYAISHIPGALNIPPASNTSVDREVSQIVGLYPDPHADFVLTCNGPFCGKSK